MSDSFKVSQWKKCVTSCGCTIGRTTTIADITKRDGSPLFTLLSTDITAPEGYPLPHVVFIRGDAVLCVPQIINQETGEERFLMIRQRRTGNGALCLEFPAGMIDNEKDIPSEVAIREVNEETGLSLPKDSLTSISPTPLYSSAGASDEAIHFFGCRVTLSNMLYQSLEHRIAGNHHENEFCTVALLNESEANKQTTSLQAKMGLRLFKEHFCQ